MSWKFGSQSWDDNYLIAQIFWPDFSLQKWKMSGNVWGSLTDVCAGATTIPRVSWSYHVWTMPFSWILPCTSFPITTTHPFQWNSIFFFTITRYNIDTHNLHTLTPYEYTHKTLSLWASLKTEMVNPRYSQSHHRHLTVDGNVAFHSPTGIQT